MDERALAQAVLCCPDCDGEIDSALACPQCARSFAPAEDGIISALPRALEQPAQNKDQLQRLIDEEGAANQAGSVVCYERAFHDEQARYYDKLFADPLPLGKYYQSLIRHQIYSYVKDLPCVVDLCCGTGKSSLPLAERGVPVVAVDVSREMLRIYKRKCDAKGRSNVIFVHADASCPPLRKASCGAISMIGGLHHIPEQSRCVDRCCGALAEGGLLIIHEPLKTGRTSRVALFLEDVYALTNPRRVWKAVARRTGLGKPAAPISAHEEQPLDFTPYERPFGSPGELLALMPKGMNVLALRSQGLLSFREFSPVFQGRAGLPLASLVVKLDRWLSENGHMGWDGDALFAVLKNGSR